MKIYLSVKNVFGNVLIYPECPKSKLFARLAKTKTLNKLQLGTIKELGYKLEYVVSKPFI